MSQLFEILCLNQQAFFIVSQRIDQQDSNKKHSIVN
jgi:hypothetical protein